MDRLQRYSRLILGVGANLQAGQQLLVAADVEHVEAVRALAVEAWRMGASRVYTVYRDAFLKRPLVELAPEESLSASEPWRVSMLDTLAEERAAMVMLAGDPTPDLLSDLDPKRVGRARPIAFLQRLGRAVGQRELAWTVSVVPTEGWARKVYGEPDLERLWRVIEAALRLDLDDPIAAWSKRLAELDRLARALTERHFDAIRYRGPGTNLTVGLLPSGRWTSGGGAETIWGQRHVPNLPTEEVFTSPDRRRAEGEVRASMPLVSMGTIVEGLEFTLHDGRIVEVRARGDGVDEVRSLLAADPGASHLGELALVDGASRVGQSGILFWNTGLDENAACHIAFGKGFDFCVDGEDDRHGLNVSAIHVDFMVGCPELEVDGIDPYGTVVPILRDNALQL